MTVTAGPTTPDVPTRDPGPADPGLADPAAPAVRTRPRTRRRRLRRAARVLARATTTALAVAVALGCAAVATGTLQVATVTSASMVPALGVGDLVVSRPVPADEARVGDVVTLVRPDGARVTHRVTATTCDGQDCLVTMRGDANALTDPDPYPVREVALLVARVPWVGGVVSAAAQPPARPFVLAALTIAAVAALLPHRVRRRP